jgi:hypothetical protein
MTNGPRKILEAYLHLTKAMMVLDDADHALADEVRDRLLDPLWAEMSEDERRFATAPASPNRKEPDAR